MTIKDVPIKDYCNCLALERGLDPVGYAGTFLDSIVIEIPLPWKRDLYFDEKVLPQGIRDVQAKWQKHYEETGEYRHRPLVIAPDDEYSHEGYRRVMFYTRPAGLFAQFDKVEYLIPIDELGALVWSLYEDHAELPRFEPYRVKDAEDIRDILVCTHGTIDVACAKFGYPLYKHMRDVYANEQLRVWRVSHFGGHVFAPTLMDMPTGHYWAYIEKEQAAQIVRQDGEARALRGHYRGWAGLDDSFQQTAECALWQQHSWDWFRYPKAGETIAQDAASEEPEWGEVRMHWSATGGIETSSQMRVEVSHKIETHPSTGKDTIYAYPQYKVVEEVQTS